MAYVAERSRGPSQKEGSKPRAQPPALNPESCAIVQPYKDFLGKGFISEITVTFDPMGTRVWCHIQDSLLKNGEDASTKIAVGDAKNRIIEKGLWTPKQGSKGNSAKKEDALPSKSLCKKDFEGKDSEALSKRVLAIAKALGDTTARGRVGSLDMMIKGVDDFDKWWNVAAPAEKTRLLSDKKHHDTFSEADHIAVDRVVRKCPFRGSVPTPSPEEKEEEKITKGGRPTSGELVRRK